MLEVPDQYIEIRGLYHICLLGSRSFRTSNFDLSTEPSDMDTSTEEIDVV